MDLHRPRRQKIPRPGDRGRTPHDMAYTGLATLAFLAADHSPAKGGPYRETVAKALDFLLSQQGPDGDLRGPRTSGAKGPPAPTCTTTASPPWPWPRPPS